MDATLREELVKLGQELYEGDITRKGYDKSLTKLLSQYNHVPGETYIGDTSVAIAESSYTFPIPTFNNDQEKQLAEPLYTFPPTTEHSGLKAIADPQEDYQASSPGIGDSIVTVAEPLCRTTSRPSTPAEKSIHPSIDRRSRFLLSTLTKAEAFVKEWTPFSLVVSYFVFSTCLYMLCDAELISIFWFIYLISNFYIAGSTVVEAIMSITPCRDARKALTKVKDNNWVFPTPEPLLPILDLITVAYLPNEKDIIRDRILYAVEEIIYPRDRIRINIVYNTPIPIESEIHDLATVYPYLRIIKVPGSTSKADNLNYFFTMKTKSDIIAVFDCDHYPHPSGPRWAAERFMSDQSIDIVQGRCVIFNSKASFLSAMIAVEFDKIYAVSHPGRAATWGFGLFTGSNGYWRSTLLVDLKMRGQMLTEDIDSSLRAVSRGATTVHDMNVVSYELAPTTFKSFWNQRLRWAQGWAQASVEHAVLIVNRPAYGARHLVQRLGLVSLLIIRELSYYMVTQYCCLIAGILILDFPKTSSALLRVLFFQYPVAYWLFVIR
jgi:cellulose synthase/poly-beta-1,6-N-acetylglucosamine synthase-like glycosyltransferase